MADITMCKGEGCSYTNTCYRFNATPNINQSYFVDSPIKDDKCDYYWGDNAEQVFNQLKDICNGKD